MDQDIEEQEIDLRSVLGVLRRQLRLIILTVLLIVGATVAVLFALSPVYTASTLVLVDPSQKDLLDPQSQSFGGSSDSARVESEVELVRSESTLLDVIESQSLLSDPEFGVKLGLRAQVLAALRLAEPDLPTGNEALQSVMSHLRSATSVQRRGQTYLISIAARSEDPDKAARIANAMANAYIREQIRGKIGSTLAARDIIQSRIEDASSSVVSAEQALDSFISENAVSIADQTGRTEILTIRRQIDTANAERSRLASLVSEAELRVNAGDYSSLAESLQSEAITLLVDQRNQLQQALGEAEEGTDAAVDLAEELDGVELQLREAANEELSAVRQTVADAQNRATELRAQLRTDIISGELPTDVLTRIYELQQNAELARGQYQTLLARLRNLETQAYLQIADSRVASAALAPSSPSFPNPKLILSIAGLGALGLGIGLAFLYENFIGGFSSAAQLESVLRIPSGGIIPKQKNAKRQGDVDGQLSVADLLIDSPLSIFAESIRRTRVGIDQAYRRGFGHAKAPDGRGMIVMVTSALPNEGKTTVALALARAYALSGKSTMIIDCDLRKPSMHHLLGIEPSAGLLEYLSDQPGKPELAAILKSDRLTGVQVAVGSRRSDIATDQLVASPAFANLIESAAMSFDVVILDTPPIEPVVDGLYLAPFADVIGFVVQWGSTSQSEARGGLDSLKSVKRPATEIVPILNQVGDARYTYRNKYASYYSEN